jgi:hypothetical protein
MIAVDRRRALVDEKRHRVVGNKPIVFKDDGERLDIGVDDPHGVLQPLVLTPRFAGALRTKV